MHTPEFSQTDFLDDIESNIKKHLKSVFEPDVYDTWVDNFVFERISKRKIVVGYYGTASLKKFKKRFKDFFWVQVCTVTGYSKKLKFKKRKPNKFVTPKIQKEKPQKEAKHKLHIARLFAVGLVFCILTLSVGVVGVNYISNQSFKESFYSVSNLKVNSKIRAIQISDLHSSSFGKENITLINRVKKLKPDIILLTGDCIDTVKSDIKSVVSLCSMLADIAPTYYIYGNNEVEKYYDTPLSQDALDKKFGFNNDNRNPEALLSLTDELETELEKNGVKVLKNEKDTITLKNTTVDVYGVLTSNPSAFWSYGGTQFDDYIYNQTGNLKITAMHEPLVFNEFTVDSWGDIIFCGHTHGGIMRLPIIGPLYTHEDGFLPARKGAYVYGRYDVAGSPLIVSSGITNNSLLRINNPPELVIVDINRF